MTSFNWPLGPESNVRCILLCPKSVKYAMQKPTVLIYIMCLENWFCKVFNLGFRWGDENLGPDLLSIVLNLELLATVLNLLEWIGWLPYCLSWLFNLLLNLKRHIIILFRNWIGKTQGQMAVEFFKNSADVCSTDKISIGTHKK